MYKKLYKSRYDVKIDGVCSGIASYMGVDATIVRVIWLIAFFAFGTGFLAYIICSLLMPREPEFRNDPYNNHFDNQNNNYHQQ